MAAPDPARSSSGDKGIPELGRELLQLTVAYAKQETVDPLKSLGRQIAFGVAGSAVASVGLVLLVLGVLRLVQVEARLRGILSFVPYLAALVVAVAVAAIAAKQIKRRPA